MSEGISRRLFLALTGGILAAPPSLWARYTAPEGLDHIILGINDLDRGIALVEAKTGVRPVFGGVHPGSGTRNALLSLGPQQYLEIMAPDPQQKGLTLPRLRGLREPRLVGWGVHTTDIEAVAKRVSAAGVAVDGPTAGSRVRPDGKTLRWKRLVLKEDRGGLLPFFIEWSQDSLHPSVDAPSGCKLERFSFESPAPEELATSLRALGVSLIVVRGDKAMMHASIRGPHGILEATS